MIQDQSLRVRMMLLFCLVVAVLLSGTSLVTYSVFSREVRAQLDRRLWEVASPMVAEIIDNPKEQQDISKLDIPGDFVELVDQSGRILIQSKNLQGRSLELGPVPPSNSDPIYRTINDNSKRRLRASIVPFRMLDKSVALVVAESAADTEFVLGNFRKILIVLLALSLSLMALTSAWYVRRSLRPIIELTRHAAELTRKISESGQQQLNVTLTVRNPRDELGCLSTTFNKLFVTVTSALNQLRQFVSDASHELRTPLSVLQGETELLLAESRSPEEYQKALRVIDTELKTLSRIVAGLFTLSMADAGQLRLGKEIVYLDEVLEEACEIAVPLARPKHISIRRALAREFTIIGDEAFLRELCLIFLENAVKYSPSHTQVDVSLKRVGGFAQLIFKDQGIGISEEDLPHIFERFFRAVGPDTGGAKSGGLGLAIAQAIVKAHGGSIDCETAKGHGSKFTVRLPFHAGAEQLETLPGSPAYAEDARNGA
jgi:two-component system, OmpR family, sensor kinase